MNKDKMIKIIKEALNELYLHDKSIINRAVREEAINHKFALYLETILNQNSDLYYNIDIEYNKNDESLKKVVINAREREIRPDIIVHVRGPNDNNLIAFQCKKKYNKTTHKEDLDKIEGLLNEPYNYKFGCSIHYLPNEPFFKIELFYGNIKNKKEIFLEKLQGDGANVFKSRDNFT